MLPRTASLSLFAAALLASGTALAQGNPSADSIINSLRPGVGITGGTRGIRPVGPSESSAPASPGTHAALPRPATPAASPGTRPAGPSASVQAEPSAPSVNLTVQFRNNSAELTPEAMRTLDELGRALSSQTLSSYRFRIEGHTDAVGSREHNQRLSEQRAQAVVDYLVSKFGVDRSRVEAVGMGQDHPLVPAGANVSEPRNRRVTVVNLGA
ncbi:MAG: OmpA family protein [Acetobacteraceae bacterium]|nr:OmpA family protein [Acetobacteraceae bacterium]